VYAAAEPDDTVIPGLNAIDGVSCIMPPGAFYAFPQVDGLFGRLYKGRQLASTMDVADFLLEEAGVALVPGQGFGDEHSIRISYAASMASLEEGLRRMAKAVRQLG
jgi:aspartate aminotransferase